MRKLKIIWLVEKTSYISEDETIEHNKSILCPRCGRWISPQYMHVHYNNVHNRIILSIKDMGIMEEGKCTSQKNLNGYL